ncbi:MAG: hypothetical protein ACI39W_03135 [Brotaphodocola sp.]
MAKQWKKQASLAYGYALTRLTLNSCLYFEELPEDYAANEAVRRQKAFDQEFQKLLSDCVKGELDQSLTGALRSRIQKEMEGIVAFTDCFQVYEYVLNRVERRFCENLPSSSLTDEEVAQKILEFVTGVKDTADMNRRMQEVISQLPIRFTRQKYYSMVQEAMSAYIGAQEEALENVMYLLDTASMTALSEEQKSAYPKLKENLDELQQITFRTITRDEYQRTVQLVQYSSEMLDALSDYYQLLQEMTNDLYLIAITQKDAIRDAGRERDALYILKELLSIEGTDFPTSVEQELCHLEGVQEEYYEKFMQLEPVPEYTEGEEEEISKMRVVERLMSTSNFVSLEQKAASAAVTREDVDAAFARFVQKTDPILQKCQKPVARAVMAATLSVLPICFNSMNEIRNYVTNSLAGCTDIAEREASIDLIHQLMEMEEYVF